MRVLTESGLVEVKKEFINNKPRTSYKVSKEGKKRFIAYLDVLKKIIEQYIATAESIESQKQQKQQQEQLKLKQQQQINILLESTVDQDEQISISNGN